MVERTVSALVLVDALVDVLVDALVDALVYDGGGAAYTIRI